MMPQLPMKSEYFFFSYHTYSNMAVSSREAVIDYEFLRRRQNETVVKELCMASIIASKTFHFKPPYKKKRHYLGGRPY